MSFAEIKEYIIFVKDVMCVSSFQTLVFLLFLYNRVVFFVINASHLSDLYNLLHRL